LANAFRIAMRRGCLYNARAQKRARLIVRKIERHTLQVIPPQVAFLVPEASKMDEPAKRRGSNIIVMVLAGQLVVGTVLAALLWGLVGGVAGYSAMLGSLTCVIPNAFLATRIALARREEGARALLRAAYLGELGKLALTVLMFGIVFVTVRPLAAGALFAGFIAAQLVTFAGFLLRDTDEELVGNNKNGE
jgi:ATP synthase protein I